MESGSNLAHGSEGTPRVCESGSSSSTPNLATDFGFDVEELDVPLEEILKDDSITRTRYAGLEGRTRIGIAWPSEKLHLATVPPNAPRPKGIKTNWEGRNVVVFIMLV